ncbi:MAG TPA: ABC transporter permease [Alphaproteobacteria bacterium]|nr:ABC transporter permease [Alphaproteobacteria bacterium]
MKQVLIIAGKEIRDGLRNRWVIAATLLLGGLSLSLTFLGSAPVGTVGVDRLAVAVVGLSSLTIYLVPLIALMLSYDAIAGEMERGTMLLLLTYPVQRSQVVLGKFLGHGAILAFAAIVGYGAAGLALISSSDAESWEAFASMTLSSVLLGCAFLALGYLVSALVRERATAAGIAVVLWLAFVLLYDLALLGALVADKGRHIGTALFSALLLANPTDAYRLFNLAGFPKVSQFAGLAGLSGEAHVPRGVLVAILSLWVLLPLAAAAALFRRREL